MFTIRMESTPATRHNGNLNTILDGTLAVLFALLLLPTAHAQATAILNPQISFSMESQPPGGHLPKSIPPEVLRSLALRPLRSQSVRSLASTTSAYGTGTLSTVAGGAFNQNGGAALSVGIGSPTGFVQDSSGNSYVSAMALNEVLKIDISGTVSVVAGNGSGGYAGDGGPGSGAMLNSPSALALDNVGNLYISDTYNQVIRKLALSTGTINTIAGGGTCSTATDQLGDGCLATQAWLGQVYGMAFSSQTQTLYLADAIGAVRQIAPSGIITTVAGGFPAPTVCASALDSYGDGCPATSAILEFPVGIAVDSSGRLYISDGMEDIIRIVANGAISIYAGQANMTGIPMYGYSGDGGRATSALLSEPGTLILDNYNNLYFVDAGNDVIRKISNGMISMVAGTPDKAGYSGDGGPATSAEFDMDYMSGLAIAPSTGNLNVADTNNERIRQILTGGNVQTVAGNGYANYFGNGGLATNAGMANPSSVAEDQAGNLYIADLANSVVRKVNANSGTITTVAGTGVYGYSGDGGPASSSTLASPYGVAVDSSGNLYIADADSWVIRKVNATTGVITTVAGGIGSTGTVCSAATDAIGDGCPATEAWLSSPHSVTVDPNGNIYIADSGDDVIREVLATSGVISTVAGTVESSGYSGDGGPATNAQLYFPLAIALDRAGNLYIADSYNDRIRELVVSTGAIQTIAGNGAYGYAGDGGPAISATLSTPFGVFTDRRGNFYISDTDNNVLREVDSSGTISTIAGDGTAGYSGDGGLATQGELSYPNGGLIDGSGNLIFADLNNSRIRKISIAYTPTSPTVTVTPSASSLTTGQPLTVTVVVDGGTGNPVPTGTVTLMGGGYTSAATPLTTGTATISIAAGSLTVGADTLTVKYSGDTNYSATTGNATVTVTAIIGSAVATVTVTPSVLTITNQQAETVKVSVTGGSGQATPTGTVVLSSGSYSSTAQILVSGTASFTISAGALSSGTDTLTAIYSGDATYGTAHGTASVTVAQVDISVSAPQSVAPGASTTATATISAGSTYSGTMKLACALTNSPTGAQSQPTCSFNPASVSLTSSGNGTSTLTVMTTASSTTALLIRPSGRNLWRLSSGGAILAAVLMLGIPARRRRWIPLLMLLWVVATMGISACGGGGSSTSGGGFTVPATTAGNYTFTVTATDASSSQITASTSVLVAVQ